MRDLGIELEEQTSPAGAGIEAGVACLPLEVPADTRVLCDWSAAGRTWRERCAASDGASTWRTPIPPARLGTLVGRQRADARLRLLLEGLLRDPNWLTQRMEYVASEDFRVITHLEWLYRVRRVAALAAVRARLWQAEPGASMAADFEEA